MFFLVLISLSLLFGYVLIILWISKKWDEKDDHNGKQFSDSFISIIIIARNEEDNIANCLQSIRDNRFDQDSYEILLVDDHSTDSTLEKVRQLGIGNIQILHLSDYTDFVESSSFKKRGITYAIEWAKGDIILTTDADCILPKHWISQMSDRISQDTWLVTGPIVLNSSISLIEHFQSLEMMGLMAVTNAGIRSQSYYLANGANLAFKKDKFLEIGGYDGNWEYASGDDMFLIDKIASIDNTKVQFLKSTKATVRTYPEKSLETFVQQRIRWATKSKAYSNTTILYLLGFIFIFCSSIIINLVLGFFYPILLFSFLLQITCKAIIDYIYLEKLNNFFNIKKLMKGYAFMIPIHIIYVVFSGLIALFPLKYSWKGRKLN